MRNRHTTIGYTPTGHNKGLRVALAAGALLVVAALIGGAFLAGRLTSAQITAAGGGFSMRDGVPFSTRHTPAGAATAAANFVA
ncbi:MAG: hypothetical protein ACRDQ5_27345, partial [Sciscionella sp.]